MTLICSLNLTIGILYNEALISSGLFKINRKSVAGSIGIYFDNFIAGKYKRRCQFKAINDSLNNIIRSLNENQVDFHSRTENLLGDNLLGVEYSTPCISEKIYLGQILDQPNGRNGDSLGFIDHSKLIVQFLVIGFLLKLLFLFIFLTFKIRKNNQNNRINLGFRKLKNYYYLNRFSNFLLTKLNLIICFYLLFRQLNLILIINNIKTNEVILNLDELIDNVDKLYEIDRYSCWIKSSNWFNFVLKSDKNSLIYKVYNSKIKSPDNICYIDDLLNDYSKINKLDLRKKFVIMNKSTILAMLSVISKFQSIEQKIGFISQSIFDLEFIKVHFISAKLNSNLKSKLLNKIDDNFEFGHYIKLYHQYDLILSNSIRMESLYENVNDLKNNFIKISSLDLEYFSNLFILLFSFYFCFLIAFIFKISRKFLSKKIVILRRILIKFNRKIINLI